MLTPRQVEDARAMAARVEAEAAASRAAAQRVVAEGVRANGQLLASLSLGRHVGPAEGVSRHTALSDLDRAPDTTAGAFAAARRAGAESAGAVAAGRGAPRFDSQGRELRRGRGSGIAVRRGVPGAWVDAGAAQTTAAPDVWNRQAAHGTRTDLQAARRAAQRPDASYDLDGDGVVSQRDYLFSVRFDRDADGKLSSAERAAAAAALRAGYAESLRDATGSAADRGILKDAGAAGGMVGRAPRQLRGVVVHEADESGWEALTRSYGQLYARKAVEAPFATQADGGVVGVMAADESLRQTRSLSVGGGARTAGSLQRKRQRRDAEHLSRAFDAAVAEASLAPELGTALLQRDTRASLRASNDAADDEDPDVDADTIKPHARHLDANPSPSRSRTELLLVRRRERVEHEMQRSAALNSALSGLTVPRWIDQALHTEKAEQARTNPHAEHGDVGVQSQKLTESQKPPHDHKPPHSRSLSALKEARRAEAAAMGETAGVRLQAGAGVHGREVRLGVEEGVGWWGARAEDLARARTSGSSRAEAHPVAPSADTLSQRTISLVDLPERRRRATGNVAEKVTSIDHWRHTTPTGPGASGDTHTHHMQYSRAGTSAAERRTVHRWTDTVLEHKHADDALEEAGLQAGTLAEDGKEQYMDPREWAPLFSSFATDNQFRDTWNAARATARAERNARTQASLVAASAAPNGKRRTSIYGTPAPLALDDAARSHSHSYTSDHSSPPDLRALQRAAPPPPPRSDPLALTPFARLPKAIAAERARLAQVSAPSSASTGSLPPATDAPASPVVPLVRLRPLGASASASTLARLASSGSIATSGIRHLG